MRMAGVALSALLLASCLAAPGAASAATSDTLMLYRANSWNFTVSVSGAGTLELLGVDEGEPSEPEQFPTPEEIEEMLGGGPGSEQAALPGTPGGARQPQAAPAGTAGPARQAQAPAAERALYSGAAPSVQAAEPALGPNGAPLPVPGTLLRNEALTFSVTKNSTLMFRFTPDIGAHIVELNIEGQDVMDRLGPDNTIALPAADAKVALEAVFSQVGAPGPAGTGTGPGPSPLTVTGDNLLSSAAMLAALAVAAFALFLISRRRAATAAIGTTTATAATTTTAAPGSSVAECSVAAGGDRHAAMCPGGPGASSTPSQGEDDLVRPAAPGAAPHRPDTADAGPEGQGV